MQFFGNIEDTFEDVVDLEIFGNLFFVDGIFGCLGAAGIEHVVPALRLAGQSVFFHLDADVGKFLVGLFDCRSPDGVEQVIDIFLVFGHTVFQYLFGAVLVAEQFGAFEAQLDEFGADGFVIPFVALVATVVICIVHLVAQFTVGAILEHGIARRALHVEHVLALLSLLPGHVGGTLDVCLWEAVEFFL